MSPTLKTWIEVILSGAFCLVGGAVAIRGTEVWPDPLAFLHFGAALLLVWRWGDKLGDAWRRL